MKDFVKPENLIAKGATASIYKIDSDKVLKLFDTEPLEGILQYEYRITCELYKKGLPIPRVYDFIEYEGKLGIIFEYIEGSSMNDALYSNPQNAENLGVLLAELHRSIHIPVKDIDMYDTKTIVKFMLIRNNYVSAEEKIKLDLYINSLPDGDILCHNDMHLGNIMINNNKTVIIDWMAASKGCPYFDVARAWACLYYAALPKQMSDEDQAYSNGINRRFITSYLNHYLKLSNYSIEQFEQWKLPALAVRLDGSLPANTEKEVLFEVKNRLEKLPG